MTARASNHRTRLSPRRLKVRLDLASDFSESLKDGRTSKRRAGRRAIISERTIRAWSNGETALSLEALLAEDEALGLRFLARVCTRLVHRNVAPYLARKRREQATT